MSTFIQTLITKDEWKDFLAASRTHTKLQVPKVQNLEFMMCVIKGRPSFSSNIFTYKSFSSPSAAECRHSTCCLHWIDHWRQIYLSSIAASHHSSAVTSHTVLRGFPRCSWSPTEGRAEFSASQYLTLLPHLWQWFNNLIIEYHSMNSFH